MLSINFIRSSYDSCAYIYKQETEIKIYLLLYVDDMLVTSKSKANIEYVKKLLISEFDMKQLGEAKQILGMEIIRGRKKNKFSCAKTPIFAKYSEGSTCMNPNQSPYLFPNISSSL